MIPKIHLRSPELFFHIMPLKSLALSVCIPTYNGERFIGRTVKSVLDQTLADYELVIVDDCSTDGTWRQLSAIQDTRIRLWRNDVNLGFAGNWNKAVGLAKGSYIKLLCQDDIIYPRCLEMQAAILQNPAYQSVQLVTSARDVIGPDDKTILTRRCPIGTGVVDGRSAVRATVCKGTNVIGEPSVTMFRRDVLVKAGLFSSANRYMVDLDMWQRILRHGDLFVLADRLSAFRIQTGSMSWTDRADQPRLYRQFVDELRKDPTMGITKRDQWLAGVMADVSALGRQLLYALYLRGEPEGDCHDGE